MCRNVDTFGDAAFGVAVAVDLHRSRFRRGREDGGRKQWKDEQVEQSARRDMAIGSAECGTSAILTFHDNWQGKSEKGDRDSGREGRIEASKKAIGTEFAPSRSGWD